MCSAPVPSVRPRPVPAPSPRAAPPLDTLRGPPFSPICAASLRLLPLGVCVFLGASLSVSFLASSYQPHPDRMKEFISSEQATHRPRARRGREAGRGPPRQPWPRSHGQAAPPCLERVPSTWPWGFPSDTCRGTKQGSKTRRCAGHSPGANRLPAPRLWELENTKNEGA